MADKKTFQQTWDNIPTGVKILGFSIVGIAALSLINKIVKQRSEAKKIKEQQQQAAQFYQQQQTGVTTNPAGRMSYAPATYYNLADTIESSLNTSFGEDFAQIEDVFKKIKTDTDFNLLNEAFGERTNYRFGIPMYTDNLSYWIADEYSGYDEDKAKLNRILAANGVNIRF